MDASSSGIMWPKTSCSSHFNCLDLRNVMAPLTTLLASCDTDSNANGVRGQESDVSHFNCPQLRNAMVQLMKLLVSHKTDANTNGIK